MKGRTWTPEELEMLSVGYENGEPVTKLAALLGRIPANVSQKARKLGLQHPAATQNSKITDREIELLRSGWTSGVPRRELAERLGRTELAVETLVKRLGLKRPPGYRPGARSDKARVHLPMDALLSLDEWRKEQHPILDRGSAIVRLIEMARS